MTTATHPELDGLGSYKFGWADSDAAGAAARRGLSEDVVRDISGKKNEPQWMLDLRLKGLSLFNRKPMPSWGSDLSGIDFENIKYFVRSTEKQAASWDDLPADIKNTYDRLGIPEAEKQRLATIAHGDGVCTTHITAPSLLKNTASAAPAAGRPAAAPPAAPHQSGGTSA